MELIRRLRANAPVGSANPIAVMLEEAADEIERGRKKTGGLQERLSKTKKNLYDLRAEHTKTVTKPERRTEALEEFARQHLPHEMEGDPDDADYEGAYIAIVTKARESLSDE